MRKRIIQTPENETPYFIQIVVAYLRRMITVKSGDGDDDGWWKEAEEGVVKEW